MMGKLFGFFCSKRETLKGVLQIFFYQRDLVVPQIHWKNSSDPEADTVRLGVHYYALILYELAELNETRVARELMDFVGRIVKRLLDQTGGPQRLQIPLGKLSLGQTLDQSASRVYQARFYALPRGGHRLEFQGVIGRENYYLPASFLGLFQFCIDNLKDAELLRFAQGLERLHYYYRFRRDFWEGTSLTEGPAFALGTEKIPLPPDSENPVAN